TVLLNKFFHARVRILPRIMIGIVAAVDTLPGDLSQLLGVPTVTAEQRHVDAELPGLERNVSDVGVVPRNENHLWLGGANLRELSGKIRVAFLISLHRDNLATHLLERLRKLLVQTDRIGCYLIVEDCRFRRFHRAIAREFCTYPTLKAIDEADTENHVADL